MEPIGYETVDWRGDAAAIPRSRRRRYTSTYQAAVVPEIARLGRIDLDAETAVAADDAVQEIARFDAELGGEIAPFAGILLRSESAASSQIEDLTASAKAIGLAELDETGRRNARLIVANTRAMQSAIDLADRLDEAAILAMHRELLVDVAPEMVGRWRDRQVWIGGSSWGPHEATYVGPHHDRVPAAMSDLVAFARRDDLPALPQAAVAHAQFETIHPFPDGNGRTGRVLVHAVLRAKQVTRSVTVPVSAGLLTDTPAYIGALTAYRDGDPNPIVAQLAEAAHRSIANGRILAEDVHATRARWIGAIGARRDALAFRVVDHLLTHPAVTAATLRRDLAATAPAVHRALAHLTDAGVLTEISGRSRNRVWVAQDVFDALDAFARRAGRRG